MKHLTKLPTVSIIELIKVKGLVHSVHMGQDRMYAVAIGRDLILLTPAEMRWFGIGLLTGLNKNDIKEE